jgi:hypothetical protein
VTPPSSVSFLCRSGGQVVRSQFELNGLLWKCDLIALREMLKNICPFSISFKRGNNLEPRGFLISWWYRKYGLEGLEQKARAAKRGLWADPQPVPPWEWRKWKSP